MLFINGCAELFQELSFSEFIWNYQIDKKNLIDKISSIFFSDIFNNIKIHFIFGMMCINRFFSNLENENFKGINKLISFYTKKKLIKKYVNIKKSNVSPKIISILYKDYEISSKDLINNSILPFAQYELINKLEKYIL